MQPTEVDQCHLPTVHIDAQVVYPALRHRGELIPQSEVVDQSQCAGMHCVTAEVAQEVGVLLQQGHLNPGPGQQQTQHHACRAAADDRARRVLRHRRARFRSGRRR